MGGVVAAGLLESVFSGFLSALLVILGIVMILVGLFAVYQTRRWPRPQTAEAVPAATAAQKEAAPRTQKVALRPASTTTDVRIRFPEIDERHPDVWGHEHPLRIVVAGSAPPTGAAGTPTARLSLHRKEQTTEVGTAPLGADGTATFTVRFPAKGEHDVIAELLVDGHSVGQTVRAVRVADYRNEIVETFEDFLTWATGHHDFVDRRMTAREFVDRYADGRPGTPTGPLERIADLYELANYSEHPIDRPTYLEMVDAFLALEEAGALEGPGDA